MMRMSSMCLIHVTLRTLCVVRLALRPPNRSPPTLVLARLTPSHSQDPAIVERQILATDDPKIPPQTPRPTSRSLKAHPAVTRTVSSTRQPLPLASRPRSLDLARIGRIQAVYIESLGLLSYVLLDVFAPHSRLSFFFTFDLFLRHRRESSSPPPSSRSTSCTSNLFARISPLFGHCSFCYIARMGLLSARHHPIF
jgi:hypothetical protein